MENADKSQIGALQRGEVTISSLFDELENNESSSAMDSLRENNESSNAKAQTNKGRSVENSQHRAGSEIDAPLNAPSVTSGSQKESRRQCAASRAKIAVENQSSTIEGQWRNV